MAVLTTAEKEALRQLAARGAVSWTKAHIDAALDAIEAAVVSTSNVGNRSLKTYIGNAVETAAPGVFSAGQKDNLFALWCRLNAQRGGIL